MVFHPFFLPHLTFLLHSRAPVSFHLLQILVFPLLFPLTSLLILEVDTEQDTINNEVYCCGSGGGRSAVVMMSVVVVTATAFVPQNSRTRN
jgi:hypothetical protein